MQDYVLIKFSNNLTFPHSRSSVELSRSIAQVYSRCVILKGQMLRDDLQLNSDNDEFGIVVSALTRRAFGIKFSIIPKVSHKFGQFEFDQ